MPSHSAPSGLDPPESRERSPTVHRRLLAETKCHSDWSLIQKMTSNLPEGDARDAFQAAVDQVEAQEDEHIRWARQTWEEMVMTRATMPAP
jgi:hypothetical protein